MKVRTTLSLLACLALAASAHAQRDKLAPGDAAPGLDIEEWVKGEETALETGSVYVVEFWATWCAPCRKSIPHLSELQKRHGDDGLQIIGVSYEEPDVVRPFVQRQGDKMGYTVAVDRRSTTKRAWMDAAGQNGIPCAFIVDRDGKIAFIGHPLSDEFESAIDRVLRGRYNPRLEKEAEPTIAAARSARKVRNWRMALKHYDDVVELDPAIFARVALERFEMMLLDMNDREGAYKYAREKLLNGVFVDDPEALGWLAEKVATDPKIDPSLRDMDFALEVAEAARRVANANSEPPALATLAMVRYQRGEIDQAVESQKMAYFRARPNQKDEYRRTLRTYQEAAKH